MYECINIFSSESDYDTMVTSGCVWGSFVFRKFNHSKTKIWGVVNLLYFCFKENHHWAYISNKNVFCLLILSKVTPYYILTKNILLFTNIISTELAPFIYYHLALQTHASMSVVNFFWAFKELHKIINSQKIIQTYWFVQNLKIFKQKLDWSYKLGR